MNWYDPKVVEPEDEKLYLIYLEKNNSYDSKGMVHYYVGRYQKDRCDTFEKDGTPIEEFRRSYFSTNGGTRYDIDLDRVTEYAEI